MKRLTIQRYSHTVLKFENQQNMNVTWFKPRLRAVSIQFSVNYLPRIHWYFLLFATKKGPIQMSQCDICDMPAKKFSETWLVICQTNQHEQYNNNIREIFEYFNFTFKNIGNFLPFRVTAISEFFCNFKVKNHHQILVLQTCPFVC